MEQLLEHLSPPSNMSSLLSEPTPIASVATPELETTEFQPNSLVLQGNENPIGAVRTVVFPDGTSEKSFVDKMLLTGRKISIVGADNTVIRKGVPVRALTASCTKVRDLLHVRPSVTQYRVYGDVDRNSIEKILDTFTTEKGLEAETVTLTSNGLVKDVLLYQACLSLGITLHHTKPLLNAMRSEITARLLTTDELDTIVNRVPVTDLLAKHLASDLCHRRFEKEIPNIAAFEKWLGNKKRQGLQAAMMNIDQAHKKRRALINLRKSNWRSDSQSWTLEGTKSTLESKKIALKAEFKAEREVSVEVEAAAKVKAKAEAEAKAKANAKVAGEAKAKAEWADLEQEAELEQELEQELKPEMEY